ncbi:Hypothetical predicted protein [Olea europaea subsp. europaea]|uniref:Uncharacterized protein n=1 Tax=Olea europaea subsp. europaea TaxID=158383 RepID=A0A8S0SDQ5_OLEEU|nr:Hypothetical predicted protein [Olea europaea subsp. europaea]
MKLISELSILIEDDADRKKDTEFNKIMTELNDLERKYVEEFKAFANVGKQIKKGPIPYCEDNDRNLYRVQYKLGSRWSSDSEPEEEWQGEIEEDQVKVEELQSFEESGEEGDAGSKQDLDEAAGQENEGVHEQDIEAENVALGEELDTEAAVETEEGSGQDDEQDSFAVNHDGAQSDLLHLTADDFVDEDVKETLAGV